MQPHLAVSQPRALYLAAARKYNAVLNDEIDRLPAYATAVQWAVYCKVMAEATQTFDATIAAIKWPDE